MSDLHRASRRASQLARSIGGDSAPAAPPAPSHVAPEVCAGGAGGTKPFPRVKQVRAYVVDAVGDDQGADCHDVEDEHWINGHPTPIANPMSSYAQYKGARKSWGINALGTLVVEVENTVSSRRMKTPT